ncbi:MAG: lysophospholipid acyltransferase family protein [Planctomycetota bacterium]
MTIAAPQQDSRFPGITPANRSERVYSFFQIYNERLFRKSFNGVRVARGTERVLANANDGDHLLIVLLNHSSWWDPLLPMLMERRFVTNRVGFAPIDNDMLKKFVFFRRLGLFGVDLDLRASLDAMVRYVRTLRDEHGRIALWLTPQGEFADPRAPIRLRPGAAAVASRVPASSAGVRAVSMSIEYAFWIDKNPEALVRFHEVETPERTTTAGWQRAMTRAMTENRDALAELAISRDPEAFMNLTEGRGSKTNPLYDLWLRLRGRDASIETRRPAGN